MRQSLDPPSYQILLAPDLLHKTQIALVLPKLKRSSLISLGEICDDNCSTINKKRYEREKAESLAREQAEREREKAAMLAKKEAAIKKLQELKTNPIGKAAGAVTTKEGIGAIGGAGVGAALGGSLGVAGKFLGGMVFVNGGWVLAGIGGLVGYLGVKAFKKHKATKEERERIIKEEQAKIKAYGEKINEDSRNKR